MGQVLLLAFSTAIRSVVAPAALLASPMAHPERESKTIASGLDCCERIALL
jgi:hypothetical protein